MLDELWQDQRRCWGNSGSHSCFALPLSVLNSLWSWASTQGSWRHMFLPLLTLSFFIWSVLIAFLSCASCYGAGWFTSSCASSSVMPSAGHQHQWWGYSWHLPCAQWEETSHLFCTSRALIAVRSLWDLKHTRKAEGGFQEVITHVIGKSPFLHPERRYSW